MALRDFLKKKSAAQLEAERQQQEQERLAQEEAAIPAHPLRGQDAKLLDDYALAQLVLRNEVKPLDDDGTQLRHFLSALGIPREHRSELAQTVEFFDDQAKGELLNRLPETLSPEATVCFLADLARLHGAEYEWKGDFPEFWQEVCTGIFEIAPEARNALELLARRIAAGQGRQRGDDFGELPPELLAYYLGGNAGSVNLPNGQYLVIDLSGGPNAQQYPYRTSEQGPNLSSAACRTTELWLRRIPAGTFTMGSPENELGRIFYDETQHQVTLTQDYFLGIFQCTQRQYELVMGSNPSGYQGHDRPVESVSYEDLRGAGKGAQWPADAEVDPNTFFWRLQTRTGLHFDLPTEAQWEYACRAGTTTALNSGKNITDKYLCPNMSEVGWYNGNRDAFGHTKVGSYSSNAWGLYDMHGNVFEWCLDWCDAYPQGSVTDPVGPTSGWSYRVIRGGSWNGGAQRCRSASRLSAVPAYRDFGIIGFRVVLRS